MFEKRSELHDILCDVLGSNNVYYQKPSNIKINYPCILYTLSNLNNKYASDCIYNTKVNFTITLITNDPDSQLIMRLNGMFGLDRVYIADNLNHYVYNTYI